MTNNSNMDDKVKTPDYLFESSWEVCNKVGGIYTVLSTKAHTLRQLLNDQVIFIGPDVRGDKTAPDVVADWWISSPSLRSVTHSFTRCGSISVWIRSMRMVIMMSLVSSLWP